ncbi:hypothetical protein BJY21_001717 [Kineosphaera limosa]|uniref:Uncharacterized protein n=1 Tax=Kineosphaera limosa NBRC 100340 TaxID=1184609 RepID=K6WMH1_9MICO|nr:hypothetical protein [Kineosphaera limosa]NYE00533.1 hypothetical protein [Kineosphaera limosa]GAB95001.1 hypothetical protein KILIM_015_00620 [Kineosphaera limosa NBRC 100340]
MRLSSADGATVELRPTRYQFDLAEVSAGARDWDANWLVLDGAIRLADGRAWAFTDPSLTTFEARQLTVWLRDVIDGRVDPAPVIGGSDDEADAGRLRTFLEPSLAFSLAARDGQRVRLRVHLSLEALPPWHQDPDGPDRPRFFEYAVELDTTIAALAEAATTWETEITNFPVR